jgi:hypothetical protein
MVPVDQYRLGPYYVWNVGWFAPAAFEYSFCVMLYLLSLTGIRMLISSLYTSHYDSQPNSPAQDVTAPVPLPVTTIMLKLTDELADFPTW